MMDIHKSELEKVQDIISKALLFHQRRDEMNASLHLAQTVRYSPLTTELESAWVRLGSLLKEVNRMSQPKTEEPEIQWIGKDRGFPQDCSECKEWTGQGCIIDHDAPPCQCEDIDLSQLDDDETKLHRFNEHKDKRMSQPKQQPEWMLTEEERSEAMNSQNTIILEGAREAVRAQVRKLVKWQSERCLEHYPNYPHLRWRLCEQCMEQLRKDVGLE